MSVRGINAVERDTQRNADRVSALEAEAERLRNAVRIAEKMGEREAAAGLRERLAEVKNELDRLDTDGLETSTTVPAGPAQVPAGSGTAVTGQPAVWHAGGSPLSLTPVRLDPGGTQDPARRTADAIAADVAAGKSLDLIARERGLNGRDGVIEALRAGGYDVQTSDPTSDNGDVRTTTIRAPQPGQGQGGPPRTVVEYYDFQHDSYYTAVRGEGGRETTTPVRNANGWKVQEHYDPDSGITTTRLENDFGDGRVVERTERPDGIVVESTARSDGSREMAVVADGRRTVLAAGQEPTTEGCKQILSQVLAGRSLDDIAADQGVTKEQLIAQLRGAGYEVRERAPSSGNGDVAATEILAGGDKVVAGHYHDHQHGSTTTRRIDGHGSLVERTEYADGRVSETVTEKSGRKTVTTSEPGGDKTVSVTFNGYTLTTRPDGSMTLTNDTDLTNLKIRKNSVEETLARTLLSVDPNSSDPAKAREAQIVAAAIEAMLAGKSYEQAMEAARARGRERSEAAESYGPGHAATPTVDGDDQDNRVINLFGQPPAGKAPSGGAWVPVRIDGEWRWVDEKVAKAIAAENVALARQGVIAARYDVARTQLETYALDPAYREALAAARNTLDRALAPHGLRWVVPEPEGSLAAAQNRLRNARSRLETASGAHQAYEEAARLLDKAAPKLAKLPPLQDPDAPAVRAPGGNPEREAANATAAHAEVSALLYGAGLATTRGDKLSVDHMVSQLENQLAGLPRGSREYKRIQSDLEEARRLQSALERQLTIADAYARFYNARSAVAARGVEAVDIRQQLIAEFRRNHAFLFEDIGEKKHRTVGGDYLGAVTDIQIVEDPDDHQLYVVVKFEEGENRHQLTFAADDRNAPDGARENPLNQRWQKLVMGANEAMCRADGLSSLKRAELAAGEHLNRTLEQELGVTIRDLDGQIADLRVKLSKLNADAGTARTTNGLPGGVEPVEITVNGKRLRVAPEVAAAYAREGLPALAASDMPVGIETDSDREGLPQWRWVSGELAVTELQLDAAEDERQAARDMQRLVTASANWYAFAQTQPLKLVDDAGTAEHHRQLQAAYLDKHEQQMLDEVIQPQLNTLTRAGQDGRFRPLDESRLAQALGLEGNREALDSVLDEVRDIAGDNPEVAVIPIFYVDQENGVVPTALVAVHDQDGNTRYVDAVGMAFESLEDFQDNNRQFSEDGRLIVPVDLKMATDASGAIRLDVVNARNVSVLDRIVDPIVGIGTAAATVASFTPLAPVAAPLAFAGGAYLGGRAVYHQVEYLHHGGEWGDRESLMNMGMIATTAFPIGAGGLRTIGLLRSGVPLVTSLRSSIGAVRLSESTWSLGRFSHTFTASAHADAISAYMRSGEALNRTARGLDWAAIGTGAPLTVSSVVDIARNGHTMSALELANALTGTATGIAGSALGVHGLRMTRPEREALSSAATQRATTPENGKDVPTIDEVTMSYIGRGIELFRSRGGVEAAARELLGKDNVLLVTGFNVAKNMPETDGPPGTALLGRALDSLGKRVTYVVDSANAPVLRASLEALGLPTDRVIVFDAPGVDVTHKTRAARERADAILDEVRPDAVVSIELPGRSADGHYLNMRGLPVGRYFATGPDGVTEQIVVNPPLDEIVLAAGERDGIITISVGDGGNEAGMGNVEQFIPPAMNGARMASVVSTDYLVTSSVSNWGAEAIGAKMLKDAGLFDQLHTGRDQFAAIDAAARAGAVDGVTRRQEASVDGFSARAHQGFLRLLTEAVRAAPGEPVYLGVMDSSNGGLFAADTLARLIREQTGVTVQRVIAVDHANAPYGVLTPPEIAVNTNAVLRKLDSALRGTSSRRAIAMACNTACTPGTDVISAGVDTPVINLIEVTAAKMVEIGGPRPVSLSTTGTKNSHAYANAVQALSEGRVQVTEIGASSKTDPNMDLATLVNRMMHESSDPAAQETVRRAVEHYVALIPEDATSVWLTCTHYPALKPQIEAALARRGMGNVKVIDPMQYQAEAVIERLGLPRLAGEAPPGPEQARPPVILTSGEKFPDGLDGRSSVNVTRAAKAFMRREDVRALLVGDFENMGEAELRLVRHAIFRPNLPQDGTLHELSVPIHGRDGETIGWIPLEYFTSRERHRAFVSGNKDNRLTNAFENTLRSLAGPEPLYVPDAVGQVIEARVLGTPPWSADNVYVPPLDGPRARGDEPEMAGKTHILEFDPRTGEAVVLPWVRGGSQDDVPPASSSGRDAPAPLGAKEVRALTAEQIAALDRDQIGAILPQHLAQMSPEQIRAFTPTQISQLSRAQWAALRPKLLRALGAAQMRAIPLEMLGAIPPGRLTYLAADQVAALTPDQLAALTIEQTRKLTPDHLAALSAEQLRALTPAQRSALRPAQTAKLSADQQAALNEPTPDPGGWRTGLSGRVKTKLVRYGPLVGLNVTLAGVVPPDVLALANGLGFFARGLGTAPLAIAPGAFTPDTRLGRFTRTWNALTFVANGAYHNWTWTSGLGVPYNPLYSISDQVSLTQNAYEAGTGTPYTPSRLEKYASLGAANFANGLLMFDYSIPFGPTAWIPNLLFGAGAGYLAYRGVASDVAAKRGTSVKPAPRGTRLATGALAAGLVTFGLHYVFENALADDSTPPTGGPDDDAPRATEQPSQSPEARPDSPPEGPGEQRLVQLVVLAEDGLNLRAGPDMQAEVIIVLRPGTLVRETGGRTTDGTGVTWVPVRGFGHDGREHSGWVVASFVAPHPEGAQDGAGRFNPDLENRYRAIVVRPGDSLGAIARQHSADVAATVSLNMDHIYSPDTLFPGDRVYLPV